MAEQINKQDESVRQTDRELITMAIRGQQEAYTALVERYSKGLTMYISEFLSGSKSNDNFVEQAEEPKDICQEAFHRAFLKISDYNPQYEFSTWLFNIARNVAIDYMRKRKIPASGKEIDDSNSEVHSTSSGINISPEEEMIVEQEYKRLIELIERLDDKYREVAKLRFINEYAYDEIAKELDLQLNTVRTRIKRAKEQLIELIKKDGE